MQRLRTIFASFFKIGLFTFGGGYAMLPLIEQELIAKRGMDRAQGILGPADPRAVGSRTDRHQYLGIRRLQDAGSQRCRRGTAGQRPAVVRHHPRNRPAVRRHPPQSGRGRGLQGHAPGCRCADRGAGFFARTRHALVNVLRHRSGGLRRMVSGLVADLHPDRRGRDRHFMDAAHQHKKAKK